MPSLILLHKSPVAYSISRPTTTIGSAPEADIQIEPGVEPAAKGEGEAEIWATISCTGRYFEIESATGGPRVRVNDRAIGTCPLEHFDTVEVHGHRFEFRLYEAESPKKVNSDDHVSEDHKLEGYRRLNAFSRSLLGAEDLTGLLTELVDSLVDIVRAHFGALILLGDEDEHTIAVARRADGTAIADAAEMISESVLEQVHQTCEPLIAQNVSDDVNLRDAASVLSLSIRSVMCVPLRDTDGLLGMIYVTCHGAVQPFTEQTMALATALAAQGALLVRNALAFQALSASEARYRALLDGAPDAIVVERDGGIELANERASDLFACPVEELQGKQISDLLPIEELWTEGRHRVTSRMRPDGTTVFLEMYQSQVFYDGEVARQYIIRDTTERRMLFARLAEMDRMASMGLMAASLTHEIRTPLSYIKANSEIAHRAIKALITAREAPERATAEVLDLEEIMGDVLEGVEKLSEIVRRLGAYSRRPSAEYEVKVPVVEIIESARQIAEPQILGSAHVETEYRYDGKVFAEPSSLGQVVLNLLVNAAQAFAEADAGRNRITVRTRRVDNRALIEVIDNGPGMSEGVRARIFEPFFTTKPAGKGTGLGLYICRNIVEKLGGSIEIDSQVGRGTTIRVSVFVAPGSR